MYTYTFKCIHTYTRTTKSYLDIFNTLIYRCPCLIPPIALTHSYYTYTLILHLYTHTRTTELYLDIFNTLIYRCPCLIPPIALTHSYYTYTLILHLYTHTRTTESYLNIFNTLISLSVPQTTYRTAMRGRWSASPNNLRIG